MGNKAKSKEKPMIMIIKFIIKSPITLLCKIRDLYVESITNCTGRISYGGAVACSAGPSSASTLPRNFSTNSSRESVDEDLRELIRVVSQKGLNDHRIKTEIQQLQQQKQKQQQQQQQHSSKEEDQNKYSCGGGGGGLARSLSTGGVIETIDENASCHFDAEKVSDQVMKSDMFNLYPRSKSYNNSDSKRF